MRLRLDKRKPEPRDGRDGRPFTINTNSVYNDTIYGGIVFTEKSDIVMRIDTVSNNDIGVAIGYDMILVKNI